MSRNKFIVNTNKSYMPDAYRDMLEQEKASAYYERKNEISKIDVGDTVFLYHTGLGIIAYGKAIDSYKVCEINGDEDEEYFIKLKFDWKINPDREKHKAVTPKEINEKLNSGNSFRKAVFPIKDEMVDAIKLISKTK